MESLFINEKIDETSLHSAYPNIKRIGIQKISATFESIKHHPRKYELFQAMRLVFEEILEYYTIKPINIKNFKDLKRIMNTIFKSYNEKYTIIRRCIPSEDSKLWFKVSINIAYISQEAGKEKEGYELYSKFCDLSKKKYDLKENDKYWEWFLKHDKKYGNVGVIYNIFKDYVRFGKPRFR